MVMTLFMVVVMAFMVMMVMTLFMVVVMAFMVMLVMMLFLGVGKLSDVMKAVQDVIDGNDVVLNSAVAVVDASKCKMYIKNFGEFFINQIEYAGTQSPSLNPGQI